jgi:putative Holliday junction resolvase
VRALGIDYGERRIGLALSDATGLLASPWKQMSNDANVGAAARRLAAEVRTLQGQDDGLDAVVIGLPKRLDGTPNDQTGRVRRLAELLAAEITAPITLQDERLTSHEADELLAQREHDWRRRKQHVDAMAAALILQDFLDHRTNLRQAGAGEESAMPTAILRQAQGDAEQGRRTSAQRSGEGDSGPTERSEE